MIRNRRKGMWAATICIAIHSLAAGLIALSILFSRTAEPATMTAPEVPVEEVDPGTPPVAVPPGATEENPGGELIGNPLFGQVDKGSPYGGEDV